MEIWILMIMVATVIMTPAVHAPLKFVDGYIFPQFGIGAVGISVALILSTVFAWCPINLSVILAGLLFLYLMMTTGWSTVSHSSLRDFSLVFLSIFGFIISTMLFKNPMNMVLISLAVFFISNLLAIYAIGQRFCFDPFFKERLISQREHYEGKGPDVVPECFQNKNFQDSRAIATIGNTNFATGYFLSALPFLVYLCFEVSPWFIISILPIVGAVIAAECRAGYLGLIVGFLFFLLMLSKSGLPADWFIYGTDWIRGSVDRQIWLIVGFICCLWGVWLLVRRVIRSEQYKRIRTMLGDETSSLNTMLDFEGKRDNSLADRNHFIAHLRYRIRYWRAAWLLIKKKPLTGYGLRTYRREVYQAQGDLNLKDPHFLGPAYQTPQPRECHNDFIENFVEGGFPYGLSFLVILGIVLCNAHNFGAMTSDPIQFLMIGSVIAGLFAFLIDVFFFFPLRLASSGLLFWITLALIEGITGSVITIKLISHPLIIIFVIGILTALIWESVIKPNVGNYFFSMYNFSTKSWKKEIFLNKALEFCPRETMFRIHAMIGYMNTYLDEATGHIETARQHFDGMVPAWAMDYNSAIMAMRNKCFESAMRHVQKALFYLPSFEDSQRLFNLLWPKTPLKRRRIGLKQITQEGLARLQALQAQIQGFQAQMQQNEISTHAVILNEKVKMAVPHEWVYDGEHNMFIPPDKIPEGKKVIEVGPANLMLLVPDSVQIIKR